MSRFRIAFRHVARLVLRAVFALAARTDVRGLENVPGHGPLIVAFNHLAHVDPLLVIANMPYPVDPLALSDLYSVPVTGLALRAYGVIPVRRDRVDRHVLRQALDVLHAGGVIILAPEARMSLTGALERARAGAAYLALKSGAPVLPVAITGTETLLNDWKRLRRPHLTATFGRPFALSHYEEDGHTAREKRREAADEIMTRIAEMLPVQYRGVYSECVP